MNQPILIDNPNLDERLVKAEEMKALNGAIQNLPNLIESHDTVSRWIARREQTAKSAKLEDLHTYLQLLEKALEYTNLVLTPGVTVEKERADLIAAQKGSNQTAFKFEEN